VVEGLLTDPKKRTCRHCGAVMERS